MFSKKGSFEIHILNSQNSIKFSYNMLYHQKSSYILQGIQLIIIIIITTDIETNSQLPNHELTIK